MPVAVDAGSVLVWATDPEAFDSRIGFDFVAGQIGLVVSTETAPVVPPEQPPVVTGMTHRPLPIPRLSGGRIVAITLTADLGSIVAQAGTRLELADEELIELL